MDENKQIEGMAKVLYGKYCGNDKCGNCKEPSCVSYIFAEKLYNAGYRKADDVIDRLMNAETSSELTEKEIEFFVKHNEKVRKETVREFVEKAKQFFYEHYGKFSDLPYKEYCKVNILCIDLDELAAQYDVEVEE